MNRLAKIPIKVPKYIERGPTDILKALATTVRYIPSEPEYVLHDDPYLLPRNPNDSKRYILSKLSGIKTAKYFLTKYPELFARDDSEPKIEAFTTPEEFAVGMEFTEEDVIWCIEKRDIVNAMIAYKSLEEKQSKLSDETLLLLFELLCYTNEESMPDPLDVESSRLVGDLDMMVHTWRTNGEASKIFNRIKEDVDPPRVYSAMIAGLCKFNEHPTAIQLFEDFKDHHQNHSLYINAYSCLLRSVPNLHSSIGAASEAIETIVQHMETHSVAPDLQVFNAILHCYRSFNVDDTICEKALKIVNDMIDLSVTPTLGTCGHLISIICKNKFGNIRRDLVESLISYAGDMTAREMLADKDCFTFLNMTMTSVAYRLNDLKLANRVHRIYLSNPQLLQTLKDKTNYFNNYFKLIITTDTLDNMLKFYDTYYPATFCPYPDTYEALAEALDLYQAPEEVVKKIGKDLLDSRIAKKIKNDAIFRRDPEYVTALEQFV